MITLSCKGQFSKNVCEGICNFINSSAMYYPVKFSYLPIIKSDPLHSTGDVILQTLITVPLLPGSQVKGELVIAWYVYSAPTNVNKHSPRIRKNIIGWAYEILTR